jgi:hypothetical protein
MHCSSWGMPLFRVVGNYFAASALSHYLKPAVVGDFIGSLRAPFSLYGL